MNKDDVAIEMLKSLDISQLNFWIFWLLLKLYFEYCSFDE